MNGDVTEYCKIFDLLINLIFLLYCFVIQVYLFFFKKQKFTDLSRNFVFFFSSFFFFREKHYSDQDEGGSRHLLAFQPSDLSDAVTDVKWSPHDSNIFGSVTSDGRILVWDVKRIDPTISHEIEPEFTTGEGTFFQK